MFGWGRPKPLRLVPFAEGRPTTFCELLCDGVAAHDLSSFGQLMAVHSTLQQEQPGLVVLATLDDLHQACYTSGHATEFFGLDEVEGHDLSALPKEVFDGQEHQGYFSRPEEFPIRVANLLDKARPLEFTALAGQLDFTPDGEGNDFVTVNSDPDRALRLQLEKHVLFQFVPVASPADSIAAFPNGYFSADLNPMQIHALARHLESAYGLALFGIGSRFMAFRRIEPLGETMARSLARELELLYAGTPPGAADRLARLIAGQDWLLLRYTES